MQGLNNPIGIKSLEPNPSPFIMNPYRFAGANWDWEEDFSGTPSPTWSEQDGTAIYFDDPNNRITGNYKRDGTNDAISVDALGAALSDTAWVWDLDWDLQSLGTAAGTFGWGDNPSSQGDRTGTHDYIGVSFNQINGSNMAIHYNDTDGAVITPGTQLGAGVGSSFSAFFRVIRQSATTYDVENFTTSARTSSERSITGVAVASTTQNLRYNRSGNNNSSSSGGTWTAWATLSRIADGVTTPS